MNWIKNVVTELTIKYSTSDPYLIAEYRNVHVVPWNLHNEIKGFYKYDKRNKYIFINNNLNEHLQKFVCAHELGHSILHPKMNTPFLRGKTLFSIDKIETEANTFAAELLISDIEIMNLQFSSIQEVASFYHLPEEVVRLKRI